MLGALLASIIGLGLACVQSSVPEDLRAEYCAAVGAWLPYTYAHPSVQWCEYDCPFRGGGSYSEQLNTIYIDRSWPFTGIELRLTLEHEYGHALGLDHTPEGIMKEGWAPPVAQGPGPADFAALAALH